MITPRRTRLIRVPDLHAFRRVLRVVTADSDPATIADSIVVVPTRGAARQLRRTLREAPERAMAVPTLATRDDLYDALHARLSNPPRRLSAFERDAMAQASAEHEARQAPDLPFRIRPGLVAEILRFYDHLRRQSQQVKRFEELIVEALGYSDGDRGAERLQYQTKFLAATFREYERRIRESGAVDEHLLRERLIGEHAAAPMKRAVISVPDWIADPAGLFVADFDLLSRLPGLTSLDLVCTESLLGSGFHERIHAWWPGLEEVEAAALAGEQPRVRPLLHFPPGGSDERPWFTHRDREEELLAVAARLTAEYAAADPALNRVAVVFKHPLPYLYLAPDTLGAAGVPYQASDALPLAAEPVAAAVDLVLDAVETRFARDPMVSLLRSPHFDFTHEGARVSLAAIGEMNRRLSDSRYLGGLDHLELLAASSRTGDASGAFALSASIASELAPLVDTAAASAQIDRLLAFLQRHLTALRNDDPFAERERRSRAAVLEVLGQMRAAYVAHHDPPWQVEQTASAVRRWIGEETFAFESGSSGVHLTDDQAARYGEFDDLTIVGLIENEWPERTRRNIFYPPRLLKALNWPSEKDRTAASDSRFLDLLASPVRRVALSTFVLEDEALVTRSIQLDEIPRARLSTVAATKILDSLSADPPPSDEWTGLRASRTPASEPQFHGGVGARPPRTWSVSALETYLTCPFKFFAQHVLRLEEEPDDEEVMDPRRQGQFVHEVFEEFFRRWAGAGRKEITSATLDAARELFTAVVDGALKRLPEGEAGLERTRLLGSPAAAGLGEAVFRMEAERPVAVVDRLLEHPLQGAFTFATDAGPRVVELRGKADRLDLLADGTFRLIDYKLGWPPDRSRALQLPVYGLCAEQTLSTYKGRSWTLGEAVYLAFKGPKRVVPLFTSAAARGEVLARAQQRLADAVDAIERGEFPPSPDDVYRCDSCSFAAVCRKDYVGDV